MSDEARRAAGVLAQCKWLRDQIKGWEDEAKKTLALELSGGERTKAVLPDGTPIGGVSMVDGAKSMRIDNEEGFLMWTKQRYPTEVVETVRDSFVKLCAEKVKVLGALPDANGEACPHVSLVQNDPYPKATLGKDADALMENMIRTRAKWWETITVQPSLDEVYDGPMEDTNLPPIEYDEDGIPIVEPEPEPEPYIEEGPPNWPESNTFETSDAVKNRRGVQ